MISWGSYQPMYLNSYHIGILLRETCSACVCQPLWKFFCVCSINVLLSAIYFESYLYFILWVPLVFWALFKWREFVATGCVRWQGDKAIEVYEFLVYVGEILSAATTHLAWTCNMLLCYARMFCNSLDLTYAYIKAEKDFLNLETVTLLLTLNIDVYVTRMYTLLMQEMVY